MKNQFLKLYWMVFVVLMAATALLLVFRRAGNLGFYTLLLLGVVIAVCKLRPDDRSFFSLVKEYWPLHLAMAGMLLAIFINQMVLQNFIIKTYDYPSRMAFFVVLLWVTLLLPYHLIKQLQWAIVAGALLAAIKMYVVTDDGAIRNYQDFTVLIPFTQMALILGFFSVLLIGYRMRNRVLSRIGIGLKLVAGVGGIYATYLSQTRGAWLAIPVFLFISIFSLKWDIPKRKLMMWFAVLLVFITVLFGSSNAVQQRIAQAQHDLAEYYDKDNPVTSLGVRLQLWNASWLLFMEHPLVGVGREGFDTALGDLEQRGIISYAARIQPHSHNEILYNMASLGFLGLIGILCMYLVPGFYFLREGFHADREIRATAGMGLILCAGFLIQGFTDVMFMWGTCANFYSVLMAILFASIIKRKKMIALT